MCVKHEHQLNTDNLNVGVSRHEVDLCCFFFTVFLVPSVFPSLSLSVHCLTASLHSVYDFLSLYVTGFAQPVEKTT